MSRYNDLAGLRFSRLTVLSYSHSDKRGHALWLCECDYGNTVIVSGTHLKTGHTKSCGCYMREKAVKDNTTHGMSNTRLFRTWQSMRYRCQNENNLDYVNYGGRGIKVCDEWNDFEKFSVWALTHGYEDELEIDRIDTNSGYNPKNCRFVNRFIQANNKRNNRYVEYDGRTHTIAEWSRILNVGYHVLYYKIRQNDYSIFNRYFDKKEI